MDYQMLVNILSNEHFCSAVLDSADRIVAFSPQFAELFKLSVGELFSEYNIENSPKRVSLKGEYYGVEVFPIDNKKLILINLSNAFCPEADEIKKSRETLLEAQKIANLGLWDWNIKEDSLSWSDEIYNIFGLKAQQFKPSYEAFLSYVHPEDRDAVVKAVNEAVENNKAYNIEHRVIKEDGTISYLIEHGRVYFDTDKRPLRMLGVVHDISDRKFYEKRLEEINVELELKIKQRTKELKDAQASLVQKEKLASLGAVIAGVSHEIRNPLNIMKMNTQVFDQFASDYPIDKLKSAKDFTELGEDFCEDLLGLFTAMPLYKSNIDRIEGIVSSMLGIAGNGDVNHVDKGVDLNLLIEQAIKLTSKIHKNEKNPKIVFDLDPNLSSVNILSNDMLRVFFNLTENALYSVQEKYKDDTNKKGQVKFKTRQAGRDVIVEVIDNGSGIKEENLSKIFEPFFTTKPAKSGTGLGLHLCYNIVTKNNGEIEASNVSDGGALFRIKLKDGGINER